MMNIYDWNALNDSEKQSILRRPLPNHDAILEKVKSIVAEVKSNGDRALFELTREYDHVMLDQICVTEDEFQYAERNTPLNTVNTILVAINRIQNYQQQCLPETIVVDTRDGVICRKVPTPIGRVGLYVPGGTAPLLSTLMMLAVPAKIAGCQTRVLCTPPNSEGKINPFLLTAAKLCGVDMVCKVGGAQAIAAMAYGTGRVPKVDKIFGPGNAWVTAAKQLVMLDPHGAAMDMPAGPSELLVIADESAKPEFIAADLLSQAEHGGDSQVILITSSKQLAHAVVICLEQQLPALSRKAIIRKSLSHSSIILVENIMQAFGISNQYAPEHLIIQLPSPEKFLSLVRNAAAVFLGEWTPESMGDYINGANHVLPTHAYANRFSGLSVVDFMKYISVQSVSSRGLGSLGPAAMQLAGIEGLEAHKYAIDVRLAWLRDSNE